MNPRNPIPVVDLFAGPGGLGEGFSSFESDSGSTSPFKVVLSVEEDADAHQTLLLRSFYRQFPREEVPEVYYKVLTGIVSVDDLPQHIEVDEPADVQRKWSLAKSEARKATIGSPDWDPQIAAWIKEAIGKSSDKWILVGGPPCQAYSVVGRARNQAIKGYSFEDDARRDLYKHYLRVIAQYWPAVFVMENVKGLLSSKLQGDLLIRKILSDLHNPAAALRIETNGDPHFYKIYSVVTETTASADLFDHRFHTEYVVRCEDYGIPQERHRVILLGVRDDIRKPPIPLETQEQMPIKRVITGLPRLRSGLSRSRQNGKYIKLEDSKQLWLTTLRNGIGTEPQRNSWIRETTQVAGEAVVNHMVSVVANLKAPTSDRGGIFVECDPNLDRKDPLFDWFIDEKLAGVCNHETRAHLDKDLLRYLYAASFAHVQGVSPKLPEFPPDLQPQHKNRESGIFVDRFRVQRWDHPSTTVTSHISKDGHYYIHPDPTQCRSLTVREAARLQTFPDNYFFVGGRTAQYTQVGNAVPPLLARQIAAITWKLLSEE